MLGRRPLDSRTRVAYAGLILALSDGPEALRLAAFHARRAAELAPVTLTVTRPAVLVLAHAGEAEAARDLVREMFGYEPEAAAALLAEVLATEGHEQVPSTIPEDPRAWMAWYRHLNASGQQETARRALAGSPAGSRGTSLSRAGDGGLAGARDPPAPGPPADRRARGPVPLARTQPPCRGQGRRRRGPARRRRGTAARFRCGLAAHPGRGYL
jgi:hypothetical protein